jgi:hypothetical protein
VPDSPLSESPYEVLGVSPDATDDELRKAHRRRLRETHPDTGGSAIEFHAVQRAWERVGTPEARAAYRRSAASAASSAGPADTDWSAPRAQSPVRDTRPKSRSYGHPGGLRRERYLRLIREWAGRGTDLRDPYDPALVRGAPYEIRRELADALAEEATARTLSDLGMGFTLWHDVAASDRAGEDAKIDHLVLGPTGLFALQSEDFGGPVSVRRGELVGAGVTGAPFRELVDRARQLARTIGVPLAAAIVVLPDGALGSPVVEAGSRRGVPLLAVELPVLAHVMRTGLGTGQALGGLDLFEVRTRVQRTVRFA